MLDFANLAARRQKVIQVTASHAGFPLAIAPHFGPIEDGFNAPPTRDAVSGFTDHMDSRTRITNPTSTAELS